MSANEQHRAFTLVELLVVMAIIAMLAALLVPALISGRVKAQETNTLGRINQCRMAAEQFFADHGDYPPTTWEELGDLEGFGDVSGAGLNNRNEGIEVFLACIATNLAGGPYLQVNEDWLGNTDDDYDNAAGDVADATQWYFNPEDPADPTTQPILELVDYWGNPLVYHHNRVYAATDGWDEADDDWEDPNDGASDEWMRYVDKEGRLWPVYARSARGMVTNNYPNLDSFQLYSWGADGYPGRTHEDRAEEDKSGNTFTGDYIYPGWTADQEILDGDLNGTEVDWEPGDGNLTNWEE